MPERKTQKEILIEFRARHGNKYDYSLVKYVNSKTKVIVICPKHGGFYVSPAKHIKGSGCRKCYDDSQKTSKDEFVRRAKEHWGEIYDYSLFDELPSVGKKVIIKCILHNVIFEQEPRNHLRGHTGCTQCKSLKLSGSKSDLGKIKSQKELNESFIKNAKKVHGECYDYSEFVYKSSAIKGKIICPKHGEFFQSPSNHLKGTKCPKCSNEEIVFDSFKKKCKILGVDYYRALKRRQAGLSEEKIFVPDYIRCQRETNKIKVFGQEYPNIEEAIRVLNPLASAKTIIRWIKQGMKPEEAFTRIPNPGFSNGIIYLITNKINGKLYVGLTIQSIERRWEYHREQDFQNRIKSEESLHAAIREFGADNFIIEQIDSGTTKEGLEKKEIEWIKKLNTLIPNGYNISTGGTSGGSNSKQTIVDGIKFGSIKEAVIYVSETRHISKDAAKWRIRFDKIDVKAPSKPGEGHVKTKLYKTWSSIVHCKTNPKSKSYIPNITIDSNWKDFHEFKKSVGEPSNSKMIFHMINPSEGYFPNNCKWMTRSEASKIDSAYMKRKKNES